MYRRRDVEEEEMERVPDLPVREPIPERVTDEGAQFRFFEHGVSFDWSPAQFLAWTFGVLFVVFGAVALARAAACGGMHLSVGGLHHTPWLGVIHVAFGMMLLLAGTIPEGIRGTLSFLGTLALAFGLIVAIEPEALHGGLGVHTPHGVLYVAVGAVLLLVSILSPFMRGGERAYSQHRHSMRR